VKPKVFPKVCYSIKTFSYCYFVGFPVTAIREIKILSLMKNENIVCLREIVTYNDDSNDKLSNDEAKEESIKDKGFSIGDVFMVFEFVDYDLSGLLKSPDFVLTDMQVSDDEKNTLMHSS